MDLKMFKGKCKECDKEIFIIKKTDSSFCSKLCEKNYKFRQRFRQSPSDKQKAPEEVRKL